MTDLADIRFFKALSAVCAKIEAVDQPCRDAIDRALETGDALDMRAARQAVDDLDDTTRDKVLANVHRQMATDLSAIWDALSAAPESSRPN